MEDNITIPVADNMEAAGFFRRLDWSAFWTAGIITFALYCASLAPTLSLEDCGELAVAGDYLGVPHPPGYPIWTMLAWIFTKVFAFVPYRGQPNPAWSIGLLSVVFGSLAAGMSAMLICRSGSDMLNASRDVLHKTNHATENTICWIGGVVSSLLFAFSPVMWSQSVIVEVYSLNAFFLVLIFLLTYRWMCLPTDRWLYATAFVFGLGLTNYQVLLLAALPLVVVVILRDMKLFRDFVIVGMPFVIVILLMNKGIVPQIVHPTHITCFVYIFLNFLLLILAYFLLPHGKTVALSFLMAELGVGFYAYMPIVSDLRNPPMNWGYPRTWEGFKHAITRGQYEKIKPTDAFSMRFIHQIGDYLSDLRMQFTFLVAPLGLLPFTTWQFKVGRHTVKAMYVTIPLAMLGVGVAMAAKFVFPDSKIFVTFYKLLFCVAAVLVAMGCTGIFLKQGKTLLDKLLGRDDSSISERVTVFLVLLGALVMFIFYVMMLGGKLVDIAAPLREAKGSITGEQFWQICGVVALIIAPALLAGLVIWLTVSKCEFKVTIPDNSQKWVIATLVGFLTMSVMLIVLANPKGDIQDAFIQRVKFISSHALYAFWIGYGLIFGLTFVDTICKGKQSARFFSLGIAALLPLLPIVYLNQYDKELLRRYGGAEQNWHDFGWQFGNYQLRGADAITEELDTGEEPLPNPMYPPEMGEDAVFFGGTDPGRFVPTYMIYSAKVREDVFLITQNALADNTYMSVMRDLYGDQIWIPAQPDSAKSFQRYVEEVQSGKRPKNASLKIENGRVQVSGALGVMEINGILAEMIFENNTAHDKFNHPFYVEESYVIRWMFPYLRPHGLIMEINRNKARLAPDVVRDDMEFWDWYVRRLLSNERFIRDVVARKSFSKLRSAIGGMYASPSHRKLPQAADAFQQARILYPLSPEANFRLVQEVYMQQAKFSKAKEVIAEFARQDAGNRRALDFLRQISDIEGLHKRIVGLESQMAKAKGKIDINSALQLADLYLKAGQIPKFMNLTATIMSNQHLPAIFYYRVAQLFSKAKKKAEMSKALDQCVAKMPADTPPEIYLDIARMYAAVSQPQKMKTCLERYLKQRPGDWKAWLDLASLHLGMKDNIGATRALEQAVRIGGNNAISLIKKNRRFDPISGQAIERSRTLINIPGLRPPGPTARLP